MQPFTPVEQHQDPASSSEDSEDSASSSYISSSSASSSSYDSSFSEDSDSREARRKRKRSRKRKSRSRSGPSRKEQEEALFQRRVGSSGFPHSGSIRASATPVFASVASGAAPTPLPRVSSARSARRSKPSALPCRYPPSHRLHPTSGRAAVSARYHGLHTRYHGSSDKAP
ncbi:corepressor interacting with RBPJ 1-like [Palaemon carinicauda]|uniref:corepressor interacting with RBPJ 1-like n=1 Tax=Palaemon carinicauda TaxID=392227 RepID=UPI0035B62FCB